MKDNPSGMPDPPRICCASVEAGMPGCLTAMIVQHEIDVGTTESLTIALDTAGELSGFCKRREILDAVMRSGKEILKQKTA